MSVRVPTASGRAPVADSCSACKIKGEPLNLVIDGTESYSICMEFEKCIDRHRMGMSPNKYQLYLKATETLALAR